MSAAKDEKSLIACKERLSMAKDLLVSSMKRLGIHHNAYPDLESAEEGVLEALAEIERQLQDK